MIMESITRRPGLEERRIYGAAPRRALSGAVNLLMMMTSSPIGWHNSGPTRDAADKWYADQMKSRLAANDANDMLYQFNASRDYDPSPQSRKDYGAPARHQLRRRCGESAGAGDDGEADAAREARPLRPAADQRPNPRPRDALTAGDLGNVPRRIPERTGDAADPVVVGCRTTMSDRKYRQRGYQDEPR